jgi:uncharacterized phage protein (TIGR01671 family)
MNQREIKFRAWDWKEGTMINDVGFSDNDTGRVVLQRKYNIGSRSIIPVYDVINGVTCKRAYLMQFTGLKDREGKEIYEGDVLRGTLGAKMVVMWDSDEACYFMREEGEPGYTLSADEVRDHEVIGNIHENPELLKP